MADCDGNCAACASKGGCASQKEDPVKPTLARIKHVFVVLSGKGGVGKSTVSANLALALRLRGQKVGLLDVDVHGPSIPKILGLQGQRAMGDGEKLLPAETPEGLKVMSTALILEKPDEPIVWRGPLKAGVIKQFIGEVRWEDLDYLVIDCPPGTGDEPLSVCQLIPQAEAVLVTTPQQVATLDVSKSISFCNQLGMHIAGIIENMSGFTCPHCGTFTPIPALPGQTAHRHGNRREWRCRQALRGGLSRFARGQGVHGRGRQPALHRLIARRKEPSRACFAVVCVACAWRLGGVPGVLRAPLPCRRRVRHLCHRRLQGRDG